MIPLFAVHMPPNLDSLIETLRSGYITQGPRVEEFERELGRFLGNPWVLTVNSGTTAIVLALRLAGVGLGDEVVTTPMTCTATNLPILAAGAIPVWADVDPKTGLIEVESVWDRLTARTKAIVTVAWGGTPCNSDRLRQARTEMGFHDILIVEDYAHALGASLESGLFPHRGLGGHFFCYSFQAIKHITTGDGGALSCMHEGDYRRGKLLRWYGIDRDAPVEDSRIDVDIEEWGYKAHMNDLAATLGLAQLPHLPGILAKHRANAEWYGANLDSHFYHLPSDPPGGRSAWWLYTILLPDRTERDVFKQHMRSKGIQVSQVHRRNDEYTVFRPYANGPLPGVDAFSSQMICLPVHWALIQEQREFVAEQANEFARARSLAGA